VGGGVEWIQLVQDRVWWRAVVNTVMNLQILAPWSYLVSRLYTGVCTNPHIQNMAFKMHMHLRYMTSAHKEIRTHKQ
jgi:hypothetical protein